MSDPVDLVRAVLVDRPSLPPESAAYRGTAGDVVRALEPYTEADPAGLLVNTIVTFGAMVGGEARTSVGFVRHPPAVYVTLAGRSSRSRKDTATREVEGIFRRVEEGWHDAHQVSGFGSGEAFIEHAAGSPGESILLHEPELGRLLAVASREGSSASSVLRAAWDFRRMEHRVRKQTYDAPPAPVSLVAHVTMDELKDSRSGLRPVEIMNGFGNRFLWVYVDRRRTLATPRSLPESTLTPLVRRLRELLEVARLAGEVERTGDAEQLWVDLYARMGDDDGPGIIGAVTARAEALVLRLSLIYALLDGSNKVDRSHLESAWEIWRYCRWSAQHIWVGAGTGDSDVDRIAAVLSTGEELTGRDLDRMFLGHRSTADLRDRAVRLGVAVEVKEGSGGRPRILLRAAGKADEADKGRWWLEPAFRIGGSSALSASSETGGNDTDEIAALARFKAAFPGARRLAVDPLEGGTAS